MKYQLIWIIIISVIMNFNLNAQDEGFFRLDESRFSFEETISRIEKKAAELGWKVPAVHKLHNSVAKAGFEVLPVAVVEVCNPKLAGKILERDDARFITPMMPIRISVYVNSGEKVLISRMNPAIMKMILEGELLEIVLSSCSSAEKILEGIIN